jgi:hypothetical protein
MRPQLAAERLDAPIVRSFVGRLAHEPKLHPRRRRLSVAIASSHSAAASAVAAAYISGVSLQTQSVLVTIALGT